MKDWAVLIYEEQPDGWDRRVKGKSVRGRDQRVGCVSRIGDLE